MIKEVSMRYNLQKIITSFILLVCVCYHVYGGNTEWRIVYKQDFGGNDKSDNGVGSDLLGVTFQRNMLSAASNPSLTNYPCFYTVCKSADRLLVKPGYWCGGSDHTVIDDTTRGYYVGMDPANVGFVRSSSNPPSDAVIFKKSLDVKCSNVKFLFSAYLANISKTADQCSYGIGIYSDEDCTQLVANEPSISLAPSNPKAMSLNWCEIKKEFVLPAGVSTVYFCIVGDEGMATNGYDVALDDITISVEQPLITIDHPDFRYEEPVTMKASFDNDGFFPDMSAIVYKWQYSKDGNTFSDITSEKSYTSGCEYTIPSFDMKNDNGTYRVVIGTSGTLDDPLCSIQKDIVVNEPENVKEIYLCYGENLLVKDKKGGKVEAKWATISTYGASVRTIKGDFTARVHIGDAPVLKKGGSIDICVGSAYKGITYSSIQSIPFYDTIKNVGGCDSVYLQTTLNVTGPTHITNPVEHICMGQASTFNNKVYDVSGSYTDSNRVDCKIYIQHIEVHDTTVENRQYNLCQGDTLFGEVFNTAGTFNRTFNLVNRFGCDSTINADITVTGIVEVYLDTTYICEGDVYEFDGIKYSKSGVYTPKEVLSSNVTGCDSITYAYIVISDRYDNRNNPIDTIICYNSKLFGNIYPDPTTTPILVRDPTIYTSEHGCDSLVYYNVTVLKIELKLSISTESNVVCEGDEIEIYVKDLRPSNTPLVWTPDPGGSNANRKAFKPSEDFLCVVKARSDVAYDSAGHHCETTDEVSVIVKPTPSISIDEINLKENTVNYSITGGTEPFQLKVDDTILDDGSASGQITGMKISSHKLYVMDANDCRDMKLFVIEPLPIEPAEYFTPNGDGVNDFWPIDGIDVYANNRVRIYNRDGKLLCDIKGYTNDAGWDGTYLGNPLPSTDYWYEIDLPEADMQYVGHFTLIRGDE